jgi:hypothetical protein
MIHGVDPMKKPHAFHPTFDRELEPRVVPSAAGAAVRAEHLAALRHAFLVRHAHAAEHAVRPFGNMNPSHATLAVRTAAAERAANGLVTTGAPIGARNLNGALANLRLHLNTQFGGFGRPLVSRSPIGVASTLNFTRMVTRPTVTPAVPTGTTGTTTANNGTTPTGTAANTGLGFFVTTNPNFGIGASTVGSPFNLPGSLSFANGVGTVLGSTTGTNTTGIAGVNNGFGTVPVAMSGTIPTGIVAVNNGFGVVPVATNGTGNTSGFAAVNNGFGTVPVATNGTGNTSGFAAVNNGFGTVPASIVTTSTFTPSGMAVVF